MHIQKKSTGIAYRVEFLIRLFLAWWNYVKACNIIHIQGLGIVIPCNAHDSRMDHILGDRIMGSVTFSFKLCCPPF